MDKEKFLICVKALILLSPIPFGCATRIWSPLFYLALLVISGLTLFWIEDKIRIPYLKKMRLIAGLFFAYIIFHLIPLPVSVLNIISPSVVKSLYPLSMEPVTFHSLSLVPAETLIFGMQLAVLALFFWVLIYLDLKKEEIYSLVQVLAISVFFHQMQDIHILTFRSLCRIQHEDAYITVFDGPDGTHYRIKLYVFTDFALFS